MDQDLSPDDALALTRTTRARLVARAATPIWYPPGYGLGCGGIIASLALRSWQGVLATAASLLWLLALYAIWRSRSGLGVSGYRRGRTLPVTIAFLAAYLIAVFVALGWRDEPGYAWMPLAAGAVLAVVAAFASVAWDRAWRADIAAGE